jgi:hypothetical protein
MPPTDAVTPLVALLLLQAALGGFDTLVDHEWRGRLASTPGTGPELRLHALRSALYASLFGLVAVADWHGRWALVPLAVSAAEIGVTARDTVVEFRLRHLPALERVSHVLLLLNTGAYTLLLVQALGAPDAVLRAGADPGRVLLAIASAGAAVQAVREAFAARRRLRIDGPDGPSHDPADARPAGAAR